MAFVNVKRRVEQAKLDPGIQAVCLAVVDRLSIIERGDGYHLGLPFFAKEIEPASQALLLPALGILCTVPNPILSMHGYLDAEDGQHHLSEEEFASLLETGVLAHPETGDLVPDPMDHVRIFYSIRDEARDEP